MSVVWKTRTGSIVASPQGVIARLGGSFVYSLRQEDKLLRLIGVGQIDMPVGAIEVPFDTYKTMIDLAAGQGVEAIATPYYVVLRNHVTAASINRLDALDANDELKILQRLHSTQGFVWNNFIPKRILGRVRTLYSPFLSIRGTMAFWQPKENWRVWCLGIVTESLYADVDALPLRVLSPEAYLAWDVGNYLVVGTLEEGAGLLKVDSDSEIPTPPSSLLSVSLKSAELERVKAFLANAKSSNVILNFEYGLELIAHRMNLRLRVDAPPIGGHAVVKASDLLFFLRFSDYSAIFPQDNGLVIQADSVVAYLRA